MSDPEPCRIKHTEDTQEQTGLIEGNEESEELSEVEEEHHDKPGEKPLSRSETKNTFLKTRRGNKSFTCTQCGKSLKTKRILKIHMSVHTEEKPFTCDQCGKSFTQKEQLKGHMRIHTGEKPFKCHECRERFFSKSHLERHVRSHWRETIHM
ncbi:gastrula zinc finger protein XlCGF8.2DB-like [Cyprinus carpio]|uniref:Gastrula zinc finger protein XlCGF8.2DB-like n=1 Tax=Cyprinus carpio TaxID=7962 RepID=A0A9Q9W582_CYPCA|nr:gastrula zinc finger protein XlCGF8.2DB-like [Cyprinus carpio]